MTGKAFSVVVPENLNPLQVLTLASLACIFTQRFCGVPDTQFC